MTRIESIVYQPLDRSYDDPTGDFIRVPLASAVLIPGHGLSGDRKAGHNPERQLNLLSAEWLAARAAEGYRAAPGQFGEQLVVTGLAVETLPAGTRLRLGGEAVIEITKGRNGCTRLEAAQGKSIAGVGPIGALARVVTGGRISVGDGVAVIAQAEPALAP